jgi:hypothetical protein
VIALPRHLRPWAPHLALFPEEIALALGPLVTKLSQLIGAARIDHGSEGTPDGYDGIDRRGSYDRLLASEWLIHDELPDEFLRRVVSGEHAFLRRLHRHEAAGRRTVALFDSGVDQLGSPRIAHLAVLIVLAQRAEQACASFAWGILQEPPGALRMAVTVAGMGNLIASRTCGVAGGDMACWLAADGVFDASEIWLIGPEGLARRPLPHAASVLAIADVLKPDAPRISVTVCGAQARKPRTVTLDVPEQRAAVRLLRDPFGAAVAARVSMLARVDADSTMVFSADGRRLHLRTADGGLLTVQIPNSPRATVGKPVTWRPPAGGTILAVGAGLVKRHFVILCRQGDDAVVHLMHKRGRSVARSERAGSLEGLPTHGPLQPLGILRGSSGTGGSLLGTAHLCFVHGNGQLVRITGGRSISHAQNLVAASRATRDAVTFVEHGDIDHGLSAMVKILRSNRAGEIEQAAAGELQHPPADACYYFSPTGTGIANFAAWSPSESRCTMVYRQQTETFAVPRNHTVIGMVELWCEDRTVRPFAVAMNSERTGIELLRPGERRSLLTTPAPITSAAASDMAPIVAFITQAGELCVYCCSTQAMLLQVAPEMAS